MEEELLLLQLLQEVFNKIQNDDINFSNYSITKLIIGAAPAPAAACSPAGSAPCGWPRAGFASALLPGHFEAPWLRPPAADSVPTLPLRLVLACLPFPALLTPLAAVAPVAASPVGGTAAL